MTDNSRSPSAHPDVGKLSVPTGKDKRRSRTGCQTCRSRKVKCDETPGRCKNCERLSLPCSNQLGSEAIAFDTDSAIDDFQTTQAGLKRVRTFRSCRHCRSVKGRCSGDRPECLRCRAKHLDCSYDDARIPAWKRTQHSRASISETSPTSSTDQSGDHIRVPTRSYARSRTDSGDNKAGLGNAFSWLLSEALPDNTKIMLLIDEYFQHIHHLRCFGFIHKATFLQQLKTISPATMAENVLVLVVCAMGARIHTVKRSHEGGWSPELSLEAGNQWATRARELILINANKISVENTMAVVLLHEHELQIGNYANAFMLTGMAVRMAQALQINLEYSFDIRNETGKLPAVARESRRRLMWSVFIMDAWVGSGVDELTLLNEKDIKIQLPCNERSFAFRAPCIVETLEPNSYLPFISDDVRLNGPVDTLDLAASFIRLISLRKKVLRFVKHLDKTQSPWLIDSEFAILETSLKHWYNSLPASLQFSQSAIRMRKAESQVGGLLLLHITYHQTLCDLNRIGFAKLFKTHCPIEFPPEQAKFLAHIQGECFDHAIAISAVFEESLRHGFEALADTWLSVVAHDSLRVTVHYLEYYGLGSERQSLSVEAISAAILANLKALKKMIPMQTLAKPLFSSAISMLKKINFIIPKEMEMLQVDNTLAAVRPEADNRDPTKNPRFFTPEFVLNPLAIYCMARRDISEKEKHAPENQEASEIVNPSLKSPQPASTTYSLGGKVLTAPSMNNNLTGQLFEEFAMSQSTCSLPQSLNNLQAYLHLPTNDFFEQLQRVLISPETQNGMPCYNQPSINGYELNRFLKMQYSNSW